MTHEIPCEGGDSGACATVAAGATASELSATSLVGRSAAMESLLEAMGAVAAHDCTVLVRGESGTGKEVIAKEIHAASRRGPLGSDGPFVPVDCTTLTGTLFESQLFGHAKGAFTGAEQATKGFVRAADGGTLFLDEIGELDLSVQAKLLRCLQERTVTPLGTTTPVRVDVRVIAATHRDLRSMVKAGKFREDLYYRLNVVKLRVPPLRDRFGDVLLLAEHFLRELAEETGLPHKSLSDEAAAALEAYSWPGNVRELANAIERAVVCSRSDVILAGDLPEELFEASAMAATPALTLEAAVRNAIVHALTLTDGNKAAAARVLRIDPRRLDRKIKRHSIRVERAARAV